MDLFLLVKTLHIVSSTILFGFGAGTAWYLWNAHLTRDPATIVSVARMVVRADWFFTGTSGVVQPASGLWLVHLAGYSLTDSWLIVSYGLYALAFICWAPVVWLQIKVRRLAERALRDEAALGPEYDRTMRLWFVLGWPAFLGLACVFWLMVSKPALW
ncbi:putative membrane protein [Hephaestia caeni]|uniref:Putative membrane protein n=1 Tax=Hephaestia caeni TaxID=645617 RepID=A0A397PC17_9SPHN|nr:DUF2269 domain-containing protein [Hephaestia caeni]RIA44667.1 putative membrane protein [Hephaestia caeni]